MKAVITVDAQMYECISPEETKTKRASLSIKKMKDEVEITIDAADPIAMKAMFNSMMNSVHICNKIEALK